MGVIESNINFSMISVADKMDSKTATNTTTPRSSDETKATKSESDSSESEPSSESGSGRGSGEDFESDSDEKAAETDGCFTAAFDGFFFKIYFFYKSIHQKFID